MSSRTPSLREISMLKGLGYLTSTMSVILLGIVSLKAAEQSPLLLACLLLGMASSVAGMFLRWRSHRLEQHEKHGGGAVSASLQSAHGRAVRDSTTA
jgi:hypothetical protein